VQKGCASAEQQAYLQDLGVDADEFTLEYDMRWRGADTTR
jgi:hypothetical protein